MWLWVRERGGRGHKAIDWACEVYGDARQLINDGGEGGGEAFGEIWGNGGRL
jgi:hypothetical protein